VDQNEYSIKFKKLDIVNSAIQTTLKLSALVAICAILASALKVMSGKQTLLNVTMLLIANLKMSEKISYILGLGGLLYGYRQRRLRRIVIENMSGHQRKLELLLDPQRTSSGITPKGTTRPDDKSWG